MGFADELNRALSQFEQTRDIIAGVSEVLETREHPPKADEDEDEKPASSPPHRIGDAQ